MPESARRKHGQRLLWFVALWIAGVAAVSSLAYAIRFLIGLS